jgi:uncharacterized protein YjbI with pentapeptide repeats
LFNSSTNCCFSVGAALIGATLIGGDGTLIGAALIGAALIGGDGTLIGAALIGATLIGAALIGAALIGGDGTIIGVCFRGAKLSRNNCSVVGVVVVVSGGVFIGAIGGGGVFCGGFRGAKLSRNNCNCSGVNVPPDLCVCERLHLLRGLVLDLHRLRVVLRLIR